MRENRLPLFILFFLVVADAVIWYQVIASSAGGEFELAFLDAGQGDSSMVFLPGPRGSVKVLLDAGPGNRTRLSLEALLSSRDRYIDVVMISHPQADHFGGLFEILKRYDIGIVLESGVRGENPAYDDLKSVVAARGVPVLSVRAGDRIRYRDRVIDILWPESIAGKEDVNEKSLVARLVSRELRALYTGDIGAATERLLLMRYGDALASEVLKIPHHGSKFSSSSEFLRVVNPALAVVEVGKNSYGHPTKEALGRIGAVGTLVFRTDERGTIRMVPRDGMLRVFSKKDSWNATASP